jgi:6,7-dimethyl-8-ribityllumazine synthase
MIKSLHIGRYLATPAQFEKAAKFLEAVGLQRLPGSKGSSVFSAPQGLISFNQPSSSHPAHLRERLKDVAKMIVLEVSNPDDVLAMAEKMKFKVLGDLSSPKSDERAFWLELPGGIVVAVHGQPETPVAATEGKLHARGKHFAIVVARFNSFITERLLQGAIDGLTRSGAKRTDIEVVRVPGSFEIPSATRALAQTGKYAAVLAIGCLLRGDTAHYDVIVNEVTRGVGQSAQETGVPHAFGVLTCDTLEQAIDRAGLKMGNKGFEAALAAIEMANLHSVIGQKNPRPSPAKKRGTRTGHPPASIRKKSRSSSRKTAR